MYVCDSVTCYDSGHLKILEDVATSLGILGAVISKSYVVKFYESYVYSLKNSLSKDKFERKMLTGHKEENSFIP